ncbi:MAG: right-handed parallel beta-helix repeat-containing protein [Pseudomonadota bacterium]
MRKPITALAAIAFGALVHDAMAARYDLAPTGPSDDCNEAFETVANRLAPGDELVLADGEYWQACRRAIRISGTSDAPILIRAARGARPILTRAPNDRDDNNIEIQGDWLILRGLTFRGGSTGVRFLSGSHITFEDNEVFDTSNNAISLNSGDTDHFVIRNNHIHHTGVVGDDTEGEGLYVGCHSGSCVASNHLIENNHIHDLRGTSSGGNDGIEIKFRSHGNVVRGNLIHDTTNGTAYPCIFAYGGGPSRNIIESNTVYHCGSGILATADAVIRNNVVLDSSVSGITIRPQKPSPKVRNLVVVNNTVAGSHPVCAVLRLSGARDVTFANNALICERGTGLRISGLRNAIARANVVIGGLVGARADNDRFTVGDATAVGFVDADARDYRLADGSELIDAGVSDLPDLPETDRAGRPRVRGKHVDVGAFESAP